MTEQDFQAEIAKKDAQIKVLLTALMTVLSCLPRGVREHVGNSVREDLKKVKAS